MAMHRAAGLALRRLAATAAAAASPSPALLLAPLRPPAVAAATYTRFPLHLTTTMAGAAAVSLFARRGYAARGGAGRKAAVAVSEDDEDDEEFEAMGSDGEFEDDFDDEDPDEFDSEDEDEEDEDDEDDAAPKRGRR